jgi:hypothetical protein
MRRRTETRLYVVNIAAQFEADNAEDAEAIAERLTGRVFEHPAVWNAEGDFDPEQKTEAVDV